MLTHGILNAQLAAALAGLRHKDFFVISDCGLPVPSGVEVIDLAVVFTVPRFIQVLDAVAPELVLEQTTLADEARGTQVEHWIDERFNVPCDFIPHDGPGGLKDRVHDARFVIRTGETTPFANVILHCGVPF